MDLKYDASRGSLPRPRPSKSRDSPRPNVSIHSLVLTYFQFLKYKATTNAGAATQRHLVNRGSLGLLPARTHVLVLVATTRCASDDNGEYFPLLLLQHVSKSTLEITLLRNWVLPSANIVF